MDKLSLKTLFLVSGLITVQFAQGQTLQEVLKKAVENYPLLKAKGYEVQARKDQVSYAKSTAVPSLDAAYQVNYATYNNITGMVAVQGFVPISGPPSSSNDYTGTFGSVGGLLLNWDAFAFGQRKSRVETAKSYLSYQEADLVQEIFQHQVKTANAYLDVVMSYELIKVYYKNLERAQENLRIVRSNVRSGLKPGVDTALCNAELSRARIELLNYENLREGQEKLLAELTGGTQTVYSVDSSFFKRFPVMATGNEKVTHPLLTLSESRVKIDQSELIALKKTMNPKLAVWGTAYGRGSGIRYDGYLNQADGLSLSRYNYGAGLVLSVPVLRFANVSHQVNAQNALIKAEQERSDLLKLELDNQNQVAGMTLENSLKIAAESPVFFQSAEFAYRTLLSRYNSGLADYTALIQSQYVLLKAEVDLKKSYLDAWKALLYKAAVEGDIMIFLNQL
jgi:outer membrane protein